MKRIIAFCSFSALVLTMGCATNPLTGEKTLALVGNSSIFPSAFQQYDAFLKENKVVTGTADAKRVEAVSFRKMVNSNWTI